MIKKMELMDWKNIERGAMTALQDLHSQMVINEIILKQAVREIKKLGGKTIDEEEEAEEKVNSAVG